MKSLGIISLEPKVHLLETFRHDPWPLVDAIEELVDNSLGEGRGNASRIDVQINTKTRRITVFDNGAGMEDIGRLFVLGDSIGYCKNDAGRFGSGGTRALLSYADNPQVYTLRDGVMQYATVNWKRLIRQGGMLGKKQIKIKALTEEQWPKEFNKLTSGTLVELDIPRSRFLFRGKTKDIVPTRLAKVFGAAIDAGRQIYVNGERLSVWKPADFETYVNKRIELKNGLGAHLIAGTGKGIQAGDAQMHINYTYRFIEKTKEAWEDDYHGSELYATVLLDDEWYKYLSPHKDRIVNDKHRAALIAACRQEMHELIAMLKDIDSKTLQFQFNFPWGAYCGNGENPGGSPPKSEEPNEPEHPQEPGESTHRDDNTNANSGGESKSKLAHEATVDVRFEAEEHLPGRTLRLDWAGQQKDPLNFYVNKDSEVGRQYMENRANPLVRKLLMHNLAAEAARAIYARGVAKFMLGEGEIARLEAKYNGDSSVIIGSMLDRKIYELMA
jgi:hypothetical protein